MLIQAGLIFKDGDLKVWPASSHNWGGLWEKQACAAGLVQVAKSVVLTDSRARI